MSLVAPSFALVTAQIGAGLSALRDGDLTARMEAAFPPAYVALRDNFNAAIESLRGLIAAVATSAEGIRGGSVEIAAASDDLARRTESNAASLEETSAAVTQIDHRLRGSATAAQTTVSRANEAIHVVDDGKQRALSAVDAMQRVSASAKGIDSVIEALDKIAFQTRVLAMNAAVGAGRAGEAGRGFAVVADLVSALAMRSEEEAARAHEQLDSAQTEIKAAVSRVEEVDGAFERVLEQVRGVHDPVQGCRRQLERGTGGRARDRVGARPRLPLMAAGQSMAGKLRFRVGQGRGGCGRYSTIIEGDLVGPSL